MATSQATLQDVAVRSLRPLTDAEQGWVTVRLDDAFGQIVATVPGAAGRLDAAPLGDPFPELVVQVQCQMVLRVLSNPDGVLEETVDDFTRRLDAAVSTGALYLTAGEMQLLSGALNGTASSGAFSVRPRPDIVTAGSWLG